MDPVDDIFAAFGNSPKQLAKATGLKVQTVCDWRKKGTPNIPSWRRAAVLDALLREQKTVAPATIAYLAIPDQQAHAA